MIVSQHCNFAEHICEHLDNCGKNLEICLKNKIIVGCILILLPGDRFGFISQQICINFESTRQQNLDFLLILRVTFLYQYFEDTGFCIKAHPTPT